MNHYKYRYGITIPEYDKMLKEQGNRCKICEDENKNGEHFCVDHCHTSGKIRGLLCARCNKALGKFKDNIKILEKAIQYLKDSLNEKKVK